MPLAIELAAARISVLSVEQISDRLDDALRLLGDRDGTAPPRQRTLRATFQWSYDLLSPTEQRLFARLAVFAGGFTLEAVEAIAAGLDVAEEDVVGYFVRLVEKSLVLRAPGPDSDATPLSPARTAATVRARSVGRRGQRARNPGSACRVLPPVRRARRAEPLPGGITKVAGPSRERTSELSGGVRMDPRRRCRRSGRGRAPGRSAGMGVVRSRPPRRGSEMGRSRAASHGRRADAGARWSPHLSPARRERPRRSRRDGHALGGAPRPRHRARRPVPHRLRL